MGDRKLKPHRLTAVLLVLAAAITFGLPVATVAQGQRVGAWLDTILVVTERTPEAAVSRLEANDIQIYTDTSASPELKKRVEASRGLAITNVYGIYWELTFNPVGPTFPKGAPDRLNPFSSAKIREAMNWLVDRRHIAQEVMGGLGNPRFLPIHGAFPDYTRLIEVARRLEVKYAYNPERARAVISEEMGKLGATLVGGKWQYRGRPVVLTFLIRSEDERRQIGDYAAGLLEQAGFTVERRLGRSPDLSPLWIRGDPELGQWHVYTGGWITTVIDRDSVGDIDFFYTKRGLGVPLWQAYKPDKTFDDLSDKLARRKFSSIAERTKIFAQTLELALRDSVRIWLADRISFSPRRTEVKVVADLAGGVQNSQLWPYTIRYAGRTGGTMKIGQRDVFVDPWNPIDGSNWAFDTAIYNATQDYAVMHNPFTGLHLNQRVERAEVFVKRGLPVTNEIPWVSLKFVPSNRVPDDALIDWDAKAQRFITVKEKHPQGLTSRTKVVVYFEKDLFKKAQWHDGNRLSIGDIMLGWIMAFDRAAEGSPIYDPSYVPAFESFIEEFRGFRIAKQDPLVVEYYTDVFHLDADETVAVAAGAFWPNGARGPAPWHTVTLGIRAEGAKQGAFSTDKATKQKVEWLNYVAGPTLAVLDRQLEAARAENYIPYAPTLGKWISAEEARTRWTFLTHWRTGRGHFWVGTGPYILQRAAPVEKIVELRRFGRFPDPSTRWIGFDEPRLASVKASGPSSVRAGSEAAYDVGVTFKGQPYPAADIAEVKYIVVDAKGDLVASGKAQQVGGAWKVVLSPDVTGKLSPGSYRLEVIVVSKVVSIPSFGSVIFTSLPR